MNREKLFRGKRVDNGEWVVGDLIHRQIWSCSLTIIRVSDDGFDHYEEYKVIPETVGQFTGLPDENSNKIFEGDIVYNGVFKAQVEFINGRFSPFGSDTFFADECEVIGNIYDNKELLCIIY